MANESKPERRRSYREGARWNEILNAATMSFREHGYEGASLQDIAGRVGMLKSSLYNYITSKEDLFFAVVERPARDFMDRLGQLRDDQELSVVHKLEKIIEQQIRIYADSYPAPFVYLGRVRTRAEPRFEEWDDYYLDCLRDILAQGVKSGELRDDLDIALSSYALLGILGWMHAWYEPRGEDADRHIAREFLHLYIGGVASNSDAH